MNSFGQRHWKTIVAVLVVVAVYFYVTRRKVIGTVDVSGEGMTVNGA